MRLWRSVFYALPKDSSNDNGGFTLVELLTVTLILAILAAVAIVNFSGTKQKAYDKELIATLRAVAVSEEAYFVDSSSYFSCTNKACESFPGMSAVPDGVSLNITANPQGFSGTASHSLGEGLECSWDSNNGGLLGCE